MLECVNYEHSAGYRVRIMQLNTNRCDSGLEGIGDFVEPNRNLSLEDWINKSEFHVTE
jgi:hypothetical protein